MFKMSIPKISEEELLKRYEQVKPVVSKNGQLFALREYPLEELKTCSYTWDLDANVREKIKEGELEPLQGRDFYCIHTYGYHGFFKPTIYEVLAQIEEHVLPLVSAFEIIEKPGCAEDFHRDWFTTMAFRQSYHVSKVRLYKKVDN